MTLTVVAACASFFNDYVPAIVGLLVKVDSALLATVNLWLMCELSPEQV